MKFVPLKERGYSVHRMTYRGDGGWSWPLASGSFKELLNRFLRCVNRRLLRALVKVADYPGVNAG
jgi:hypothetical protein